MIRRPKVVRNPVASIKDATSEELSYIAALVDGEGSLGVKDGQPRIVVTMKSALPLTLAEQYGGYWYVQIDKLLGSVYYSWYIQGRPLIDDFLDWVGPYSRIKSEQFKLLREVLQILDKRPPGYENEFQKITKRLKELHGENPEVKLEAASLLDRNKVGWRKYLKKGTKIEREP